MSETTTRRCQSETCRRPVLTVDHGEVYPLADVVVICIDPMKVRCPHCGQTSEWKRAKARA